MRPLPSRNQFSKNPASAALLNHLLSNEQELSLTEAILYDSFPLYRDEEGAMIVADAVLLSRQHGIVTFALTNERHQLTPNELQRCLDISELYA